MSAADNVVWLEGAEAETHGVPVDEVLDRARDVCEEVVVLGYLKGNPHGLYAASSFGTHSAERTVWMLEQAKKWLLAGCPEFED